MSRRRSSNGEALGFVLLIFLAIYIIYKAIEAIAGFVGENYVYFIAFFVIAIIVFLLRFIIKYKNRKTRIKKYESTPYYKETNLPYHIVESNLGLRFEMYVFNQLYNEFPGSYLITNLLIPRKGSVNEYSEIDMVFLNETGLYVLELKNYSGYIFGNISNDKWNVGYERERKKIVYEFYNPVKQNETHINDLKTHTNREYINYVIFSNNTEIDSNIENLSYIDGFVKQVKSKPITYNIDDLKLIRDEIKSLNVYENMSKHIERLGFNETKYSGYNKRP